jgi:hypothetical protein
MMSGLKQRFEAEKDFSGSSNQWNGRSYLDTFDIV